MDGRNEISSYSSLFSFHFCTSLCYYFLVIGLLDDIIPVFPLNFDWSADYIACKLQEALRVTFREEIALNLVPVGSKKVAGAASNKQEARYTVLPMHTTFVIRHLAFCTEFQRYVFNILSTHYLNSFKHKY